MYCTSYSDALAKCVFSKVIVSKLSKSGLGFPHLKLVFERSGADGLDKIIKLILKGSCLILSLITMM